MTIESQQAFLEMGTGTGGAVTITDITLAYPTILTAAAHGLSRGDVVAAALFAGDDAASINGNTYVVLFVTTNTFAIDLNSTALTITDNTDGATMTPETWTEIGECYNLNLSGNTSTSIDKTHLRSNAKEYMTGLVDYGSASGDVNYLSDDAGQLAMRAAQLARTEKSFRLTYADLSTKTFVGSVTSFDGPNASVDGKLEASFGIKVSGEITDA